MAETMAVNLASRRVLEKAGLSVVRVFHQPWPYQVDGRELGDVEYALSKDEWEQQYGIAAGQGQAAGLARRERPPSVRE